MASVRSVLVFRIGSLGDTLVALPAMSAIRRVFPAARITLLSDHQIGKNYVLAPDLLDGAGVVDDFMGYPSEGEGGRRFVKMARMARLLARLRRRGFEVVVYLAPSERSPAAVARDRWFFRAAGIARAIGMTGWFSYPEKDPSRPMALMPAETDLLLARLRASGIPVPEPGQARIELNLTDRDHAPVETWLRGLPSDGGRAWVGVGPGTKMPSKLWPEERFREVLDQLIARFDVWPVVFGGPEDRDAGNRLVAAWGRGFVAAGALGLRPSASALARCVLHVGNDTGTTHMAAAVGVPCVAVYSSRSKPGVWYPYGQGHRIHRTPIDCEGCELITCVDRGMECILRIDAQAVTRSCIEVLDRRLTKAR